MHLVTLGSRLIQRWGKDARWLLSHEYPRGQCAVGASSEVSEAREKDRQGLTESLPLLGVVLFISFLFFFFYKIKLFRATK